MIYNKRAIISGTIVEIYEYERMIFTGKHNKNSKKNLKDVVDLQLKTKTTEEKEKNLKDSARRSKNMVKRLVNANLGVYTNYRGRMYPATFLTFTFKENIQDLEFANREFTKFIQRLNYATTGQKKAVLKYVAVNERQERGAIHYHVVFFNLPFVPVDKNKAIDFIEKGKLPKDYKVKNNLYDLWGHGGVDAQALAKDVKNADDVGSYMTKYMTKSYESEESETLSHKQRKEEMYKKRYLCSKELEKPLEVIMTEKELAIWQDTQAHKELFTTEFENEHLGKCRYTKYSILK